MSVSKMERNHSGRRQRAVVPQRAEATDWPPSLLLSWSELLMPGSVAAPQIGLSLRRKGPMLLSREYGTRIVSQPCTEFSGGRESHEHGNLLGQREMTVSLQLTG